MAVHGGAPDPDQGTGILAGTMRVWLLQRVAPWTHPFSG